MTYQGIKNISYSASLLIHIVVLVLFLFIKFTIDYPLNDYVELSFGTSGQLGSSGGAGVNLTEIEEMSKPEEKSETIDKNLDVKEVELPQAENTEEENIIKPADKDKEQTTQSKTESEENTNSELTAEGQGNKGEAEGGFGFDINWGGMGQRKIYSYLLPAYPEGVYKEINIRLRFTILPDGSVGSIILLTKADTKLENAAINSLRQWRFEPLSTHQKQSEQTAVIVFPYRLQ